MDAVIALSEPAARQLMEKTAGAGQNGELARKVGRGGLFRLIYV
jgi:hypothetical protein